jgi:hypothetical protein
MTPICATLPAYSRQSARDPTHLGCHRYGDDPGNKRRASCECIPNHRRGMRRHDATHLTNSAKMVALTLILGHRENIGSHG